MDIDSYKINIDNDLLLVLEEKNYIIDQFGTSPVSKIIYDIGQQILRD